MLTRRQFLVGSGALIAGSVAGGIELSRHPNALYRLGLENSPDYRPPPSSLTVERGEMVSHHMSRTLRWAYSLPDRQPLATIFCLHGRGAGANHAFDSLRLHDMAAEARLPIAIASVDGGDHSYWHRRVDGTDALAMLVDEFIPFVESRTGTTQRGLYGWSMGGFGALNATATHPREFFATVALSPALWTQAADAAPGAFDGSDDFRSNDVFVKREVLGSTNIYVACGIDDPFHATTKQLVATLPNAHAVFSAGFHDDAYWRSATPAALQFIGRSLSA